MTHGKIFMSPIIKRRKKNRQIHKGFWNISMWIFYLINHYHAHLMQMKFKLKFHSEIQTCIEGRVDKVRALFTLCVREWAVCGCALFYWSGCEKAWLYKTAGTPRTYKENLLYKLSIDISVWFQVLWCTKMRVWRGKTWTNGSVLVYNIPVAVDFFF